jgi:import inner membrane translocase subunit TIM16
MAVGPLARLLAQLGVMGFSIASKAFMTAYAQAVQTAKQGGGAANVAKTVARRNKMQGSQARQILNLDAHDELVDLKLVDAQFERYFAANDPDKGGSFYLQSKIFRAKESLEWEFNEAQREQAEAAARRAAGEEEPAAAAAGEEGEEEGGKGKGKGGEGGGTTSA